MQKVQMSGATFLMQMQNLVIKALQLQAEWGRFVGTFTRPMGMLIAQAIPRLVKY